MDKVIFCLLLCFALAGCVRTQRPFVKPSEPVAAQINAARKVVGAMAPFGEAVEKYSPVTGKHYSGVLEYEPGTGVKLIPVEE